MIDRQLGDSESRKFRYVWYTYSVVSLVVTAVVASCFIYSMYKHLKKAEEAWEEDGLCVRRLVASCVAELLHLGVAMHVGADFILQGWQPLREAAEHKALKQKEKRAANKAK